MDVKGSQGGFDGKTWLPGQKYGTVLRSLSFEAQEQMMVVASAVIAMLVPSVLVSRFFQRSRPSSHVGM